MMDSSASHVWLPYGMPIYGAQDRRQSIPKLYPNRIHPVHPLPQVWRWVMLSGASVVFLAPQKLQHLFSCGWKTLSLSSSLAHFTGNMPTIALRYSVRCMATVLTIAPTAHTHLPLVRAWFSIVMLNYQRVPVPSPKEWILAGWSLFIAPIVGKSPNLDPIAHGWLFKGPHTQWWLNGQKRWDIHVSKYDHSWRLNKFFLIAPTHHHV